MPARFERETVDRPVRHPERGMALIVTLLAMALLSAVGAALVLTASADALIAEHAGASADAAYAAEAAIERALAELRVVPDFTAVLGGAIGSSFTDGPASGARTLPGGGTVDLDEVVHHANCARASACSDAEMDAFTEDRPWGGRNPRWRLFSYGPLDNDAASGWSGFPVYVVVLVADDPLDADGVPDQDGLPLGAAANPGAGMLLVRADAFGRRDAHRVVEVTLVRHDLAALARWEAADPATRGSRPADPPRLDVLSWHSGR
jgi:hypothetical protein